MSISSNIYMALRKERREGKVLSLISWQLKLAILKFWKVIIWVRYMCTMQPAASNVASKNWINFIHACMIILLLLPANSQNFRTYQQLKLIFAPFIDSIDKIFWIFFEHCMHVVRHCVTSCHMMSVMHNNLIWHLDSFQYKSC